MSSTQEITDQQHYLDDTDPSIFYPSAIATQLNNQFVINLDQIKEYVLVMVQGYASVEILRRAYPDLKILGVDMPLKG